MPRYKGLVPFDLLRLRITCCKMQERRFMAKVRVWMFLGKTLGFGKRTDFFGTPASICLVQIKVYLKSLWFPFCLLKAHKTTTRRYFGRTCWSLFPDGFFEILEAKPFARYFFSKGTISRQKLYFIFYIIF